MSGVGRAGGKRDLEGLTGVEAPGGEGAGAGLGGLGEAVAKLPPLRTRPSSAGISSSMLEALLKEPEAPAGGGKPAKLDLKDVAGGAPVSAAMSLTKPQKNMLKGLKDGDPDAYEQLSKLYAKDPKKAYELLKNGLSPYDFDQAMKKMADYTDPAWAEMDFRFYETALDMLKQSRKDGEFIGRMMADTRSGEYPLSEEGTAAGRYKRLLEDLSPAERKKAVASINKHGGPLALADVAYELGKTGDPRDAERFLKDLAGKSPTGRTYMAEILRCHDDAKAKIRHMISKVLEAPLDGPPSEAQDRMNERLGLFFEATGNDKTARAELMKMLQSEYKDDWSNEVKAAKRLHGEWEASGSESTKRRETAETEVKSLAEFEKKIDDLKKNKSKMSREEYTEELRKVKAEIGGSVKAGASASYNVGLSKGKGYVDAELHASISGEGNWKDSELKKNDSEYEDFKQTTSTAKSQLQSTIKSASEQEASYAQASKRATTAETHVETVRSVLKQRGVKA